MLKLSLLQKDSMRISKPSSVHLSDSFCISLERILLWIIKSIASLNPTLLLIHVNKTEACFSLCECPDRGTEGGKVLHGCWGHKPLFLLYPPAVHSQSHVTAQDGCFSCHHHHLNSNYWGEEKRNMQPSFKNTSKKFSSTTSSYFSVQNSVISKLQPRLEISLFLRANGPN